MGSRVVGSLEGGLDGLGLGTTEGLLVVGEGLGSGEGSRVVGGGVGSGVGSCVVGGGVGESLGLGVGSVVGGSLGT